jgi:magnesium-transporting ATPase (P-type)
LYLCVSKGGRENSGEKQAWNSSKTKTMNSNITAYIIYITLTIYIIFWIGRMFHRNGRVFILQLYHGDVQGTDTINNILLIAYYLFNIGYAFMRLRMWEEIRSPDELISSIGYHLGLLILILAVTHYFNMLIIYFLSKKHKTFTS